MSSLRDQYKAWKASKTEWRKNERQRLLSLSEKELLAEIALDLKEINAKCDEIQRKQMLFGN